MTLADGRSHRRLGVTWLLASVVVLLAMLAHKSDEAEVLGRYSRTYAASLAVMLVMVALPAAGFALSRRLPAFDIPLPRAAWFGWAVVGGSAALIGLLWLFLRPSRFDAFALFSIYLASVVIAGALAVLRLAGAHDLSMSRRRSVLVAALAVGLALLLAVTLLGRVPPVRHYDEPIEVNTAWSLFTQGRPHQSLYPDARDAEGVSLMHSFLLYSATGRWMDVVGVGLRQFRLLYLLVGWASLPFIYLTARRLYGGGAALCAVAIGAFIPLAHNYARPDMFVGAVVSIGLLVFLLARERESLTLHWLAGLVIAFGAEGHKLALRFVVAFGLVYAFDYARTLWRARRWRWYRPFWCFALGVLTYGVAFVGVQVITLGRFPGLDAMLGVYAAQSSLGDHPDLLTRLIASNRVFYQRYLTLHPQEVLLVVVAVLAALWRRKQADCLMLAVWLSSALLLALTIAHANEYYWVHSLPFIAILGGALVAQIGQHLLSPGRAFAGFNLATVMALCAVVVLFAANTWLTARHAGGAEELIVLGQEIDQMLPADITVTGAEVYYLGMPAREHYLATGNFLLLPVTYWGVPPPQAIILTRGFDDMYDEVHDYIEGAHLARARCFPIAQFGGEVTLYLPEALLPAGAPRNCRDQP